MAALCSKADVCEGQRECPFLAEGSRCSQTLSNVRVGSTIEFRKERAVVAQWGCARTRGNELSTYPVRRQ
jgi:hypothetical protein